MPESLRPDFELLSKYPEITSIQTTTHGVDYFELPPQTPTFGANSLLRQLGESPRISTAMQGSVLWDKRSCQLWRK
jgi:hypothetical protein